MSENINSSPTSPHALRPDDEVPFGATAMRLSLRQWTIVCSSVLILVAAIPVAWQRIEPLRILHEYRVPYALSQDYWLYHRFVSNAVSDNNIVIIGDSVIWGEYVTPDETLSAHLSSLDDEVTFANGGANGTHPLALHGLVQHYTQAIHDSRVILHLNLLWLSSPERDLSTSKELAFNHPRLVPQFSPWIPCYRASANERLGIAVDRNVSFRGWVHHLRVAYFDAQSISDWTIEHPCENPLRKLTRELPGPNREPHSPPIPWTERGIGSQNFPWVQLDASLQWQAFQNTVRLLRSRGNRLFVLVNPFNEHMLTEESRKNYHDLTREAANWLRDHDVPFAAPPVLPPTEYADASHPLRAGYARMARHVNAQESFQTWKRNG